MKEREPAQNHGFRAYRVGGVASPEFSDILRPILSSQEQELLESESPEWTGLGVSVRQIHRSLEQTRDMDVSAEAKHLIDEYQNRIFFLEQEKYNLVPGIFRVEFARKPRVLTAHFAVDVPAAHRDQLLRPPFDQEGHSGKGGFVFAKLRLAHLALVPAEQLEKRLPNVVNQFSVLQHSLRAKKELGQPSIMGLAVEELLDVVNTKE